MEILIILVLWIVVLYIIKLNREIYGFRKYYNQHKDIYVPSYKEIVDNNLWYIQLLELIKAQLINRSSTSRFNRRIKDNPGFVIINSDEHDR